MGQIGLSTWQTLLEQGECVALTVALSCARRGDSQSLSVLCREMARQGPGPAVMASHELDATIETPVYECLRAQDWDDASKAARPLITEALVWKGVRFEQMVALCLSRNVEGGQVVQPRSLREDRGVMGEGFLPMGVEAPTAWQRELLNAAAELYARVPGDEDMPKGLLRLAEAVVPKMAWPGLVPALVEGGLQLPGVDQNLLSVHALRGNNPLGALAIAKVEQQAWPDQTAQHQQALFDGVNIGRSVGVGSAVTIIHGLRNRFGDDHLAEQPAFAAVIELCDMACGVDAHSLWRRLHLVGRHVDVELRHDEEQGTWSEPFVRALMKPLESVKPQALLDAVEALSAPIERDILCTSLSRVLKAHCLPVVEVLQPLLPQVMDSRIWHQEGYGGWDVVTFPSMWHAHGSLERWRSMLDVIVEAGIDLNAPIADGCLDHTGSPAYETTPEAAKLSTPLHRLAMNQGKGRLERMIVMLERGADPHALDHAGRTPGQCLGNEALEQQWDEICRSHLARRAAYAAQQDVRASCGLVG